MYDVLNIKILTSGLTFEEHNVTKKINVNITGTADKSDWLYHYSGRTMIVGISDVDILVYNYCEGNNIAIITIVDLAVSYVTINTVYTCVKLSTNVSKHCKTCHDKCQLS